MNEQIGKRIGDYEILGVLGAGGMGQVLKVRNVISDRVEAMKVLLPDLAGRQDLANRFLREIKVLAALNHPNIASLRTALTLDNQLVMVMEYVEGVTLAARLEQGAIPVQDALNYTDQVLKALSYAHQQNVIHRDIKPANMMLTPQGAIKLMDFGIARSGTDRTLTSTGTTLGSLHYMSPEQVRGAATDARSDLYSVGVSLYEMVTGHPPFSADSDYSLMAAQLQQQPKPPIELCPNLPAALNELILTAMEKDPANRFQTADAFRNAVNSITPSLPKIAASPVLPATPPVAAAATELFQGTLPTASTPKLAPFQSIFPSQPQPVSSQPLPALPISAQPQAEPAPGVIAMSPRRPAHRGLYMSLGALIVVAVLVAAGLYMPRHSRIGAHEISNDQQQPSVSPQPEPSQPTPDASNAGPQQSGGAVGSASGTSNPTSTEAPVAVGTGPANHGSVSNGTAVQSLTATPNVGSKAKHAQSTVSPSDGSPAGNSNQSPAASGSQDAESGNQQMQAANTAQLEELGQEMDQLSSRANSVSDSLDTLKRQQSAQGFGLRGDISSTQELMKTNIAKAQAALQNQDAKNAKKYLDLAQSQVESLEKFLGH